MIRLSRKEDYSMVLIHTLAKNYKKRLVPLSEIARKNKLSLLFFRNLANELKHAGIVGAVEGKNGGYFLQKDPQDLTIGEILATFSKPRLLACCPTPDLKKKNGICDKITFCETGKVWRKIHDDVVKKVYTMSIIDFMQYAKTEK